MLYCTAQRTTRPRTHVNWWAGKSYLGRECESLRVTNRAPVRGGDALRDWTGGQRVDIYWDLGGGLQLANI